MEIWLVSFVGGLVGSLLMDFTETAMAKFGISSGVNGAFIGRWFKGLAGGKLSYDNIAVASPVEHEVLIGQVFHFVVGGGVVALFYPLFLIGVGLEHSSQHLMLATIFGFLTSVLPWLILMPSFGWGLFGSKAPQGSKPIVSPLLSHIPYGFGIGLTLLVYQSIAA